MRDAFGGAFLIKIILIFLFVYVAFMAVALNYAKAFRIKNQIINIIEQYEGYNDKIAENGLSSKEEILTYIERMGYNVSLTFDNNEQNRVCENGYCITKKCNFKGTYYLVETFVHLELPFFSIDVTVPISGETRIISGTIGIEGESNECNSI